MRGRKLSERRLINDVCRKEKTPSRSFLFIGSMISDDGSWRRLEFERIEVGWDPIHSSKASSALAFQSWKNGENKFISIKIFSRQRRDLHLPIFFFFTS